MKNMLFLLSIAVILLWGCTQSATKTDETAVAADTAAATAKDPFAPDAAPVGKAIDTVHAGNKTFIVYFIDKATFDQYPQPIPDTSEKNALAKDTSVTRIGSDLYIRLANNKQLILSSNSVDDGDAYIRFKFTGDYPAIKRKGFEVTYYEADGFELVNPENGDTLLTWTAPVISPDKKYFICATQDLIEGYNPNGFQLFEVNNNDIKLTGEVHLRKWGMEKAQWIDNKTIISTYQTEQDRDNDIVRYVKLVMQ